jgi:two-component system, OmpR family, sensor kinase
MSVLGRLRSLRNKLALLFGAITAVAFAVMFFFVIPELGTDLEDRRLADLERVTAASSDQLERVMGQDIPSKQLDGFVRALADATGAQITLLGVQRSVAGDRGLQFYVITDSKEQRAVVRDYGLASEAVRRGGVQRRTASVDGEKVGRAAKALRYRGRADWVAVYSRSFDDVSETVGVIRTRVLIAGVLALVVALLGGYLIARVFARRVRRLEGAAKQVAGGTFIDPLPVDSEDELGQLTRTFNDMQSQLARVDKARKDFIANASHELRTPIFSLGGFVELLRDEDIDPETRDDFLRDMTEQVARLQKLAVDLLDLSRLDTGSLELHEDSVDLAELARGVVGEFAPAVSQRRTELELRLPEEGVGARCDPARVAQIMRILLDNALRHTPEGTHVTVSANADNGAAEFTVADTGPGLDTSPADRVFDRFYTADAGRGSGLGLAIAKELAERMSGRIVLRSRPGKTVFTLELPAPPEDGPSP